ncbi:MAG: type II toxin-antitoxin system VapC family toxin [Clostridia bacterium]|nr:type II toxin-antitoxin system VapC family toxin [Deltaproteobacteria bacterium]
MLGEETIEKWRSEDPLYVSALAVTEAGRVIDRLRHDGRIDDETVATLHDDARTIFEHTHIVDLSNEILARAAGPFPTVLRTLDAIHVSTALAIGAELEEPVTLFTHDKQQALAARALGLRIRGI